MSFLELLLAFVGGFGFWYGLAKENNWKAIQKELDRLDKLQKNIVDKKA